ncbi:MAG: capsular biosynthesis protein CpsI [Deltaproteobacteria bacterium]|nr:capsular biosynthesis protein CpsI [Deltaproteobacteria bacterium]MBK05270.1 capsular biosynthesis protein CpsI [Deltaproteobacteria bacterium]|tara:strand:- start:10021 stop:11037 length:1017 start_codon:yes stop_codon:yes gene_type:complete
MQKILVTGAAGFIGFHLSKRLLSEGKQVLGVDIVNDYYDVTLKEARLEILKKEEGFQFWKTDLADLAGLEEIFKAHKPDAVVNLAAQAGVRYSIQNPHAYMNSNLVGFLNILECARHYETKHFVYASSSSVYGANTKTPFSVHDNVDHPISLYAASKKSNELIAHSYSHLYRIPSTGLRFFTVYGPWGRPDMALYIFTKAITEGKPINIFNHGKMMRDFTYIDDIVEGVRRVIDAVPTPNENWSGDAPDPSSSLAPYQLFNIGNNKPVELMYMIETLEKAIGREAEKNFMPMQPGDVPATYADINALSEKVGFRPDTSIEEGIQRFVDWYKEYNNVEF